LVGEAEGLIVGASVGPAVGSAVGAVGANEGAEVGSVGAKDGCGVGEDVGLEVVGSIVIAGVGTELGCWPKTATKHKRRPRARR
jgi:hypothetical protein